MNNIAWISNGVKVSIFAVFGVLFAVSGLYAQDSSRVKFLIGSIGSYNLVGYNTNIFGAPKSLPDFENFGGGSASTQSLGISILCPLFDGNRNFLVIEGVYDSKSAGFLPIAYTSFSSGILSEASLSASLDYVLLNVGLKHNFFVDSTSPTGIGVQVCVSLGRILTSKFTTVLLDTEGLYSSGHFTPIPPETSISNIDGVNSIRIALRTEITYDIPFFTRLILTPSVGYDAPLTKVDNTDRDWWASSLYGAIALRYAFGAP